MPLLLRPGPHQAGEESSGTLGSVSLEQLSASSHGRNLHPFRHYFVDGRAVHRHVTIVLWSRGSQHVLVGPTHDTRDPLEVFYAETFMT